MSTTTVLQLITDAYYLSSVVARDFKDVTGAQTLDGLRYLQNIMAEATIGNDVIPYVDKYDFVTIPNEKTYFIPNLISVETLTYFFQDNVRMGTTEIGRREMFGSTWPENTSAIPCEWHLEPSDGGGTITLRFAPDKIYPMQLYGQFRLPIVAINDVLTDIEQYYVSYLTFMLAKRIAMFNLRPVPQDVKDQIEIFTQQLNGQTAPMDLDFQKMSVLGSGQGGFNWWLTTGLYRGFNPPGGR